MTAIEFLYLSQEDVIAAGGLDMKMVVEGMERAFKLLNAGKVIIPNKIVMTLPPGEKERGRINGLAAYIGGDWEVAGIKWIPGFPNNPSRYKLPRANAFLILNDTNTGMPLVIMDGTLLSAMRTGAIGGGVGAKYLARKDSEVAAIIGMGVQARTQALALKTVLPKLKEIRGFDVWKDRGRLVAKDIEKMTGITTKFVDTPKEAVEGADVIDTVTVADEPIVKDAWVKKGNLFIHMGSYIEEEYDVVLHANKIIVDDWEIVKHRKTPVLARMYDEGKIKDSDIYANLDEIVAGKKKGRETDDERIFFSPIGMAHEDVAVASLVYEQAKKKGIGKKLQLWNNPLWV
jgi:ornithine cyclodeaminase/alanine dehydrogenase-like protein (mu-crystallin family)